MKNAFDGLPNRLDVATKRISEPEERSIENSKTEMQRGGKKKWKITEYPRTVGHLQELLHVRSGNTRRRKIRNRSNI